MKYTFDLSDENQFTDGVLTLLQTKSAEKNKQSTPSLLATSSLTSFRSLEGSLDDKDDYGFYDEEILPLSNNYQFNR